MKAALLDRAERCPVSRPVIDELPSQQHALDLPRAYDASGGVIDCDTLSTRLRDASTQPISILARWIVERRVVSFNWRGRTLLPAFQFDLGQLSPRAEMREVIAELPEEFDEGDLADWFARDNVWLAGRAPAAALASDLPAVLHAARADRFIAAG
jgi:hypothetical protein